MIVKIMQYNEIPNFDPNLDYSINLDICIVKFYKMCIFFLQVCSK